MSSVPRADALRRSWEHLRPLSTSLLCRLSLATKMAGTPAMRPMESSQRRWDVRNEDGWDVAAERVFGASGRGVKDEVASMEVKNKGEGGGVGHGGDGEEAEPEAARRVNGVVGGGDAVESEWAGGRGRVELVESGG
ncbi:hypothetical protein ZIOFF_054073 [Zingiber officinale]|uniref:Uncharacterized protein n=1 Tax=Zingiber officinale TaxID=94328 RepID=A0A8J5FD69_ZINOF|nr:hypothetical protein ZIOFF_054073 [Zingiber officinale]